MSNQEVTTNEIMEFLQTNMVTRDEFNYLEGRVCHIENQMVTKDYLDDKFANFGVKIGQKINGQSKRHEALIDILAEKAVLQEADVERLKK